MLRRLLCLIVLLALPGLAGAQDFIRYYPSSGLATMTGTATATTTTVPLLLPDGTVAAPALAFSGDSDTGFFWDSTGTIKYSSNGTYQSFLSGGEIGSRSYFELGSSGALMWASGTDPFGAAFDTKLYRDAANTLALRNSTSAQTLNVYHTYTNTTNYERGRLKWNANVLEIGTTDEDAGGTGTARTTAIVSGATGVLKQGATTIANWDTLGFYPGNSDTYSSAYSTLLWTHGYFSRSIQGSKSKTLTDNTATAFATMAMPQTAGSNYGGGQMIYTIFCKDAANQAQQSGTVKFACMNLAGTESCGFGTPDGVTLGDGTASLGTPTFTAAAGADLVTISVQSDCTGIAPTTHTIQVRFDLQQPNTLAFP